VLELGLVGVEEADDAARVGAAVVLEGDGALDEALVEVVLEAVGHVPGVFPDFVGFEELVLVEELDAVEVELAFFGHGEFRVQSSEFRVRSSEFRVQSSGSEAVGLRFLNSEL
jgi:hypothetical protein